MLEDVLLESSLERGTLFCYGTSNKGKVIVSFSFLNNTELMILVSYNCISLVLCVILQNQLMRDLKEASSKWCLEQSSVLLGSVQLLKVLCLEDEDVDEALDKLQKAEFSEDRMVVLEPFSFFFTEMKDMNLFLEHVIDESFITCWLPLIKH